MSWVAVAVGVGTAATGAIAANNNKADAPGQRNLSGELENTFNTQLGLANPQLNAYQQFSPAYANLYNSLINQSALGNETIDWQGYLNSRPDLQSNWQDQGYQDYYGSLENYAKADYQNNGRAATGGQFSTYQGGIGDTISQLAGRIGGEASQNFDAANPQLAAFRNSLMGAQAPSVSANAITGRDINPSMTANAQQVQAVNNNWQANPFERVTAGSNSVTQALAQQTQADLALGGKLGAQEQRQLEGDVLARFNRAGRANDPSAIAGVALNLDSAQNARLQQRQNAAAQAAGLVDVGNAQSLAAQQANQGAGLQLQGYGLQSALANQQYANQTNYQNQGADLQSQLANMQQRFNYDQSNQSNTYRYDTANQNASLQAALANQQAQLAQQQQLSSLLQNTSINPYGLAGGALGMAQNAANYQGSGQFDPLNSYAQDLYNTNYNANAANNIANANNSAALLGAGIGTAGSLFGTIYGGRSAA